MEKPVPVTPAREKVFGIGLPKTGTTTLGRCFEILGYRLLDFDYPALEAVGRGDLEAALNKTENFDAFEDAPWCLLYRELAARYPHARFILTTRKDAARWIRSARGHDLRTNAENSVGAAAKKVFLDVYQSQGLDFDNPAEMYQRHNAAVGAFFSAKPNQLLKVCWEEGDGWDKLCGFLGAPVPDQPFPHENAAPAENASDSLHPPMTTPQQEFDLVRDARQPIRGHDVADVKHYYERMTPTYLEGFGEVFQGSRPESTDELLEYILKAASLEDGMKVLDAGCGVCGPAMWFAGRRNVSIEALTISPTQKREAQSRVEARGMAGRITVREGDFHELASIYPPATFDRVLFLETLCHARDYRRVLEQARKVLKPGGFLYIKDFYCKDFRSKPELAEVWARDIKKLNDAYQLVLPDIPSTLDLILELGYEFKYVREPQYDATFTHWLSFEQKAPTPWAPQISYIDLISGMEIYCRVPG